MARGVGDLAIFGGKPLFSRPRPIAQLAVPDLDDYLALVREVLTGDGVDIVDRLERKLAALHGTRHAVTVANAALGIMMLLQIVAAGRRGEVIMPGFSFRGLPQFAEWVGLQPRFCDVDPQSHALDPAAVAAAIGARTLCILAVCNINSPGDIDGLCRVAATGGVPIFFDSVYALGATYRGRVLGGSGRAEIFSIQATKLLNGFEGGYVTTDDDALAAMLRWQRRCAPAAERPAAILDGVIGLNAKLDALHAAMAYLSLDRLDAVIARNRTRIDAYRAMLSRFAGLELLPYPDADGARSNYEMAVVGVDRPWPLTRDRMLALLRAEGAAIRPYYSPALHLSFAYPPGTAAPYLPTSEALARRYLHLPVGELVSLADIERLGELFDFVAANGEAIAARLQAQGVL